MIDFQPEPQTGLYWQADSALSATSGLLQTARANWRRSKSAKRRAVLDAAEADHAAAVAAVIVARRNLACAVRLEMAREKFAAKAARPQQLTLSL